MSKTEKQAESQTEDAYLGSLAGMEEARESMRQELTDSLQTQTEWLMQGP